LTGTAGGHVYVAIVGGVGIDVGGHNCRTHTGLARREQLARRLMMMMVVRSTHIPRRGEGS
jgi:hypothetical protein